MHQVEYGIWQGMLNRCRNPNTKDYKYYGARGVTVCLRWRSFDAFLSDMGSRPSRHHSIERIDNLRGYEPGNCKWATRAEQSKNQRRRMDNTSGVTGVNWLQRLRKWQAYIGHNGRVIYLGVFNDIESAAAARRAKAAELGFPPGHGGGQ